MAVGLEVDVRGDVELRRKLSGMRGALRDLRRPLGRVADDLSRRADRQFATQGAAFGTPWQPLSPATVRARSDRIGYYGVKGARGGVLVASGDLRRSFTDRSSQFHVREIDRGGMEWGSKNPLAHLHAQGPQSRGPAPPLPKREIIAFRDAFDRSETFRKPLARHVTRRFSR